ncbi:MAG: hypothetical protein P8104_08005, partial [Gammaproteobacteria bacterium]
MLSNNPVSAFLSPFQRIQPFLTPITWLINPAESPLSRQSSQKPMRAPRKDPAFLEEIKSLICNKSNDVEQESPTGGPHKLKPLKSKRRLPLAILAILATLCAHQKIE